jgi:hypothetical protein
MTPNQERVLLPLVSLLKAHGVGVVTIDEVMEIWASSTHGIRFVMPRPRKMRPRKDLLPKSRSRWPI